MNPNIHEIFIGDSHIQTAINDSLMEGCMSFAQSAESIYFSYFKLKAILTSNPQIERVYLGYSYHNLSNYYDDIAKSKLVSPKYFFILPFTEQFKHVIWNIKEFPSYFKGTIKSGLHNILNKKDYTFLGGYSNIFRGVLASKESMDKRLHFQYYTKDGKLNHFSDINLSYLSHIIRLCKTKNVELILFNTPLHSYYRGKLPIDYINKYNKIVETNNLKVIDFSALTLDDECFVPDGDHLSEKGASIMTQKFSKQKNTNAQDVHHNPSDDRTSKPL